MSLFLTTPRLLSNLQAPLSSSPAPQAADTTTAHIAYCFLHTTRPSIHLSLEAHVHKRQLTTRLCRTDEIFIECARGGRKGTKACGELAADTRPEVTARPC